MTTYPTQRPSVYLPAPSRLPRAASPSRKSEDLSAFDVFMVLVAIALAVSAGAFAYRNTTVAVAAPPANYWTATPAEAGRAMRLAKYEPAKGCYIGAFIDFDKVLALPYRDKNKTEHQDPAAFEGIIGKSHAMYFFYLGYGRPLPSDWVTRLSSKDKFVHIALEPNHGLLQVKEDAYLQKLADDMRATGARIFLRFASEMNGDWTNYHGNPALYRLKFRLVSRVMRERAPNVAMVWCPYATPDRYIPNYYPGDDATDWVGVNMYNVTHHNNDPNSPAYREAPADLLRFVYDRYSARKPIMICEYGATHRALTREDPCPGFARQKILALYRALPTKFPRVKCINYFDGNNMEALPDRGCNDYSVTNDPLVLAAYRKAIANPHFLGHPLSTGAQVMVASEPVKPKAPPEPPSSTMVTVWICADSGLPSNSYCPESVPRQFPSNRVPKGICRVHGR
jgi:hypothetical protein